MSAKKGDIVTVDYVGICEGKVFDTSIEQMAKLHSIHSAKRTYAPIVFELGSGMTLPGFEKAIEGMSVGEEKTFALAQNDAYGFYDKKLVKTFPRGFFSKQGIDVSLGSSLVFRMPSGTMTGVITEMEEDNVTLDMNHDLAGKTLQFRITLKDSRSE
ncbi:MAG: peptidylprolyl isomerase [Candidatus Woesearchaeota archaeon]